MFFLSQIQVYSDACSTVEPRQFVRQYVPMTGVYKYHDFNKQNYILGSLNAYIEMLNTAFLGCLSSRQQLFNPEMFQAVAASRFGNWGVPLGWQLLSMGANYFFINQRTQEEILDGGYCRTRHSIRGHRSPCGAASDFK